MKAFTFIAITLLSGAIAGTILALVNQVVVEPFIERAIDIENQHAAANGEMVNPTELAAYRLWQKSGSIAGGAVLGLSLGALLGLVFAYGRKILPGSTNLKKAVVLAGVMWVVLYLVPALKYPANPPAVGNPETIYLRMSLYVAILAISGFSALGLAILSRKVKVSRFVPPSIYAGIIAVAFVALPTNPDAITAPMDLVNGFRIASGATMTMFWILAGAILGTFWDRTKPHETSQIKTA